jgi:hypothetical protein
MKKTIDERIDALTQTVELIAGMQQKNEEHIGSLNQSIGALTKEVRRFVYWSEAVILNHESRLRALAKEPPPQEPA